MTYKKKVINLAALLDEKDKVISRGLAYRVDANDRRMYVIWESIRRSKRYKQLYDEWFRNGFDDATLMKILDEFKIAPPIDPKKTYSQLLSTDLFEAFGFNVMSFPEQFSNLYRPIKRYLLIGLKIDMSYSDTKIFDKFKETIAIARKHYVGPKKLKKGLRQGECKEYSLADFKIYDYCEQRRTLEGARCFRAIAKEQLQLYGGFVITPGCPTDIEPDKIESFRKRLRGHYNKVKRLINGDFRQLM